MIGVVLLRVVRDAEAPAGSHASGLVLDPGSLVALGQALSLRAGLGSGELLGLAAGPETWERPLREALALGLDEVRRVAFAADPPADVAATAVAIAGAVPRAATAVFAGPAATDHGSGALPGALAAILNLPLISEVSSLSVEDGSVHVRVRAGGGRFRTYRVDGPALFVAATQPPPSIYPPLARRLAAQRRPIPSVAPAPAAIDLASHLEFLGYGPARPRTRHLLVPEASAAAGDRISQLMGGGMARRESAQLGGGADSISRTLVDLLERQGLLVQA